MSPFNGKNWVRSLFRQSRQDRCPKPARSAVASVLEELESRVNPAPVISVRKGVVAVGATSAGVFTPADPAPGPLTFTAPGTAGTRFSGGTINNAYIAANPTALNSDVSGVDAGDVITFAIVVRNTGDQNAFDIRLRDTLLNGYARTGVGAQGVNLTVTDGAGNPVAFTGSDIFSANGIEITDDANGRLDRGDAAGTGPANDAAGTSTVVITYDLQVVNIFETIPIDTFNAPTQNLVVTPPGGVQSGQVTGSTSNIIGAQGDSTPQRDAYILTQNLGAGGGGNLRIDNLDSNILTFSLDSQTAGFGVIQWDGDDGSSVPSNLTSPGLQVNGLNNLNVTQTGGQPNGADRIIVNVLTSDLGASITLRVWSNGSATPVEVTKSPASSGAEALTFLFSEFAGADFTRLGAIEMQIDPPAEGDVAIDQVVIGAPRLPCGLTNTATVYNAATANFGANILGSPLSDSAVMQTGVPIVKTVTATSVTGTNNSATGQATIGETITYQITYRVPEGIVGPVNIVDTLDSPGLVFVTGSANIVIPGTVSQTGGSATPSVSGNVLTFNLGTLTNNQNDIAGELITITYQVRVENDPSVNAGVSLNNSAQLTDHCSTRPAVSGPQVEVVEPTVGVTKTLQTPATVAPGATGTYRIVLTADPNDPTAFEVSISDTVPSQLTGLSFNVVTTTGTFNGATPSNANFSLSGNDFTTTTPFDMDPGASITIDITGTIASTTLPQQFSNTADVDWSSLNGLGATGERTYTDSDGPTAQITVTGDYGDAPNSYGTTLASDGARHNIVGANNPFLGATPPDAEADATPNAAANGDGGDEDGITGAVTLTQGATTTVPVVVGSSTAGQVLYAFVDFNRDGDFADSGETLTTPVITGGAGTYNLVIPTPVGASVGTSYLRLRISTDGGLTFVGAAPNGEVEDYQINITQGFDWGDLPDTGVGTGTGNYQTSTADNGPRHGVSNLRMGAATTDSEADGQPNAGATGDDGAGQTPDDEDGVTVVGGAFIQGRQGSVQVVISGSTGNARLYGFIDWNQDGDFADTGEVVSDGTTTFGNGTQTVNFAVPDTALGGTTGMRWRISTASGLTSVGSAANGEVEDYIVTVTPSFDFGDAPGAGYSTGTASHALGGGLRLGTVVDSEDSPTTNVAATGDDTTGTPDDEDGVTFVDLLGRGQTGRAITIVSSGTGVVDAWFDWDQSGTFDAGERVTYNVVAGTNNLTVDVPSTAVAGDTYARFRLTTAGIASPTASAPDGEIEDYLITVRNVADLQLTKDVNAPTFNLGDTVTFTITVTNTGPSTATGVTIRDTLPAGLTSISQFSGGGTFDTSTPGEITWTPTGGTIAASGSVTLVFTGVATQSGSFNNYAQIFTANEIDPNSTPGDGTPPTPNDDDEDDAPYSVNGLDFGDAPDPTYPTLLASNGARHITTGSTLGATRDSENNGQQSANATGDGSDEDGVVLVNGSTIAAAGGFFLTQGQNNTVTVNTSAGGFLSLWVDLNQDGDWNDTGEQIFNGTAVAAGDNTLTVNPGLFASPSFTTFARFRLSSTAGQIATPTGLASDGEVEDYQLTIRQVADLNLVKDVTPTSLTPGDTVTFTITVTNSGPNAATGVVVRDTLPSGLTSITQTGGGGTFNTSTPGQITWTPGGTLAVGGSVVLTYTAVVTAEGSFNNYAQIQAVDQFDSDSQPNNGTPPTPNEDDEDDAPYTVQGVDFGDAPNTGVGTTYPVTLAQNGARHIATGPTLGATRDTENDGQPNATATGDGADEDGVTIGGPLTQGVSNSITVNASAPGFLNAWIDFNHDGDWDDVGEQIATNLAVVAGDNTLTFTAPLDPSLVTFDTFARFRLTSATVVAATPTGLLPDGEVEDYQLTLRQVIDLSVTKGVSNPTPALGTNVVYTITVANGGPNGATNVTVRDLLPAGVTYVSDDSGTTGTTFDSGTGVWTIGSLANGGSITLQITVQTIAAGTFNNFVQVTTADQFDVDSQPNNGTPPTPVQDDEAAVSITVPPADFGDAPTAAQSGFAGSYPTTLAQNGARHGIGGPTLGTARDSENNGLPSVTATGDDLDNTDDEDGVTTLNVTIGTNQTIQVNASGSGFLNAWIDFNQDGDWDDPGEQVFTNTPVFAGSNFPVVPLIPLTATPGNTYARFRLTSATVTTPTPTGTLPDGEVEDYQITVQRIADYGDAPDTYGTTIGNSGAGHIALGVGPYLGTNRPDTEVDGVPTIGADGDDAAGTDDEDGVTIPNLFAGQTAAFTILAPEGGRLDAFIDWNGDGDFNDAGERVTAAGGTLLTAGSNTLNVTVPANFVGGPNTYLRFRISAVGGLNPTGLAANGEVEDYRYTNSSIAGRVYVDNRLTGWQDAGVGSPPLAGVTINLLDGTGTFITSTVTDANGNYLFPNLAPGNYQVQEVQPTTGNFFEGFDTPGSTGGTTVLPGQVGKNLITGIVLPIGTNSINNNFGEIPPADPNGFVYNDLNANGLRDPGEPGIPGVTIRISGTAFAGTPIARPVVDADIPGGGLTRVTDANGFYEYAIMPPGVYTITEAANPPGFIDGLEQNADTVGPNTVVVGNDNFSNIFLAPNPIRGPFNFGEVLPASVAGAVYQDGNRNGVRDTGDQPIAGVVITLTGTDFLGNPVGPITTTTDANGNFSFTGLRPGTYNVAEAQPQSFSQGTNAAGSAGGILVATDIFGQIVLGSGTNATNYLFGEVNPLGTTPEPVAPPGPLPPLTTTAPGGISKRSFLSSTGSSITGPFDPDYNALGSLVAGANRFLSTSEGEGGELVRTFDLGRGQERFRFRPFPGNPGGVRAVTADITGDGVPDTIAVPGPGTGARLIAYNGNNGAIVQDIQPFESTFTGGMFVASGDFNGDGVADLVVSADVGGGPRVKVIDGATGATLADFMGIDDASFRGGARVAVGDINGDGIADLVVAAGFGGGPRVAVFDGASVAAGNPTRLAPDFFAFESTLRNGVFVAVGDIDGDGFGDIITGAGPGGGPRVLGFSGTSIFGGQPTIITDFFAGDQSQRGGVPVSALDVDSDGRVEIITGSAPGGVASVKFFNPQTGAQLNEFFAERGEFLGGVFVG